MARLRLEMRYRPERTSRSSGAYAWHWGVDERYGLRVARVPVLRRAPQSQAAQVHAVQTSSVLLGKMSEAVSNLWCTRALWLMTWISTETGTRAGTSKFVADEKHCEMRVCVAEILTF